MNEIQVLVDGKKTVLKVSAGQPIRDVAKQLSLNKQAVIVKLNNKIAHPSKELKEGDVLEFVNVIYGG